MLAELLEALGDAYNRLADAAPPGSLPLTGVLGLAALLVAYYQLRRSGGGGGGDGGSGSGSRNAAAAAAARQQQQQRPGGAIGGAAQQQRAAAGSSSAAAAAAAAGAGGKGGAGARGGGGAAEPQAPATPLGRAVRRRLAGARRVTLSSLGLLVEQAAAHELADGADLRPGAAALLRELALAADAVYVLTHVADDVGQAAVLGALEAAGCVGRGPGQVPPHRLLFCATLDGKASIVRQIEPDLHADGAAATVEALRRFMPRLLHVLVGGGGGGAVTTVGNVTTAPSLAAYFDADSC